MPSSTSRRRVLSVAVPIVLVLALLVVLLVGLDRWRNGDDPGSGGSGGSTPASAPAEAPSPPALAPAPANRGELRPRPAEAEQDRPDLYADGCQVGPDDDTPTTCAYGASPEDATATIAVIGDSKSGQWSTALQALALDRGWRVLILTKSACAAVAVPMSMSGEEYASCTRFNETVNQQLVDEPVDLLLTSNSSDAAYVLDDLEPGEDPVRTSLDEFVRGEQEAWSTWIDAGNRVAVISDIPRPNTDGESFDLPTCVIENPDYAEACAFDLESGNRLSGREGQVRGIEAAGALDVSAALYGQEVPGADEAPLTWIDPVPLMCPDGETCPPADGDILIYREGSHLTRTYVASLTDRIGSVMTALGMP